MVRSASSRVSNHEAPISPVAILRDAAKRPLLRMRACPGHAAATAGFGREIISTINAATRHSAPATKKAGR
jgi:hypothetical protein